MRYQSIRVQEGKKRFTWAALALFVPTAYLVVIGAAELFWYLFTGGFSPLIGLYALFAATLLVVRTVGEMLSAPAPRVRTG
jgi:hypothetical protein